MKRNLTRIQQFLLKPKSACRNVSNHPPAGGICPHADFPRTESPTPWDNSPANSPLSVPNLPLTGGIGTLTGLPASRSIHSLDESTRCQASHSPDSSSHWNNRYVDGPSGVQMHPAGGGNGTLTCRVVSVWRRKRIDWRVWRMPSRLRGTQSPGAHPIGRRSRILCLRPTVPSLCNHQHADFAFRRMLKNDIGHQRQCDSRSRALQNSRGHQRIGKFNVQAAITQPVIQSTTAVRKSTQLEFAFER